MIPQWVTTLSIVMLVLGVVCAAVIVVDLLRDPQHMWIMNIVWPVTSLFGGTLTVWTYFTYGKLAAQSTVEAAKSYNEMA